jgi:hypothetical protein
MRIPFFWDVPVRRWASGSNFSKERVAFIFKSPHLILDSKGNTLLRKNVTTHPTTQRTSLKTES